MLIERSIEIARPPQEVFSFVSDPSNDPIWCPKVRSVTPRGGTESGPGAQFEVVHRPVPFLPDRRMEYTLVEWEPPWRIVWTEDDGHDRFVVTYRLEPTAGGTRLTQRDEVELGAPRPLRPLMKIGIGFDIAGQLRRLRKHLEASDMSWRAG